MDIKMFHLLKGVRSRVKKALFLLTILLYSSSADAEVLYVASLTQDALDLTAAIDSKNDLIGDACALLKIVLPEEAANVIFEGNTLSIQNDGVETYVYISHGSKELTIKSVGFEPLHINFPDYGIPSLQSQQTYKINVINMKSLSRIKKSANGTALAYSIIPGLGLIQKGRTGEGVAYLIGDVALVGAGIGFYTNATSQKKIMNNVNTGIDEYNKAKSKYNSSKTTSYICFGAAGAIYVANLIRSYVAKPKPKARINWNIVPVATNIHNRYYPEAGISLAMTYTF